LNYQFYYLLRAIVPQLAMSAGTMTYATKEIIMGSHSSLGPIDPQFGGIPATGVIEEFENVVQVIQDDPASTPLWQAIIGKYHLTFLGECEKAIAWSKGIVKDWLLKCMFDGDETKIDDIDRIVEFLADHSEMKTHSRHITLKQCQEIGLKYSRVGK